MEGYETKIGISWPFWSQVGKSKGMFYFAITNGHLLIFPETFSTLDITAQLTESFFTYLSIHSL